MKKFYKTEKRGLRMTISRDVSDAFTIATATCTVKDSAGTTVETGSCTIDDATITYLADFTKAGYVADQYYVAEFTATLTGLLDVVTEKMQILVAS